MKSKKSLSLSLSRHEKEEIRKKNKKHIFVTGEREEIKKKNGWCWFISPYMKEKKKVENCLNLLCKCLYIHRRSLSFLGFFFVNGVFINYSIQISPFKQGNNKKVLMLFISLTYWPIIKFFLITLWITIK